MMFSSSKRRSPRPFAAVVGIAFAALAAVTSQAAAESEADYAHTGSYLGVGVVFAKYTQAEKSDEKLLASLGYVVDVDYGTAIGGDVQLGYRLIPHLAAQIHFQYLPGTEVDAGGVRVVEVDVWTLTADVKGYLLTGRIQPYALVGGGYMRAKVKDTLGLGVSDSTGEPAIRVGGGIDFYLTENFALEAELGGVFPSRDLMNLDQFTFGAGLQLRF